MCTEFLLESLKGRDYLEDLDTNERILKRVCGKQGWRAWIGFIWLKIVTSCCEYGNEHSYSIEVRDFRG
jgi:hypothetical protein